MKKKFYLTACFLLKYFFLVILSYFSFSILLNYERHWDKINFEEHQIYLVTFAIALLIYQVLLKKHLEFWEVFFHELTHVFFAFITFNRIEGFTASFKGGGVTKYNGKKNWLIDLSPYLFPIHTFPLLLLALIVASSYQVYLHYLIVISYALFLVTAFKQFSLRQTDLKSAGYMFSILLVPQIQALLFLFMVFYLQNDTSTLIEELERTAHHLVGTDTAWF